MYSKNSKLVILKEVKESECRLILERIVTLCLFVVVVPKTELRGPTDSNQLRSSKENSQTGGRDARAGIFSLLLPKADVGIAFLKTQYMSEMYLNLTLGDCS